MREVRVCSPCLLGITQIRHNTTPFELEFLLALRAVNNARRENAKILKFKMRVPNTVSRNRTRKTEALKYKSCLAISMDAKKRIERKTSLI